MPDPNDEVQEQQKSAEKPKPTLEALLKSSEYAQPQPPEEREWVDAPPAGKELL